MRTCLILSFTLWLACCGCNPYHPADRETAEQPSLSPHPAEVTFPCNIAPPNFTIQTPGERYQTEIGIEGQPAAFHLSTATPTVQIPPKKWRTLLGQAAGKALYFRISIQQGHQWVRYADIHCRVSTHPIDPFLTYRLLYPGYELWNEMGIYQRDLTSYQEEAIVENRHFGHQCVNCHSFNQHRPDEMMLHVRGAQGGTLIAHNGKVEKVNPKAPGFNYGPTYPAWHPSGRYLFFATNEIQQFFHASGSKPIEVSDLGADLMAYDMDQHIAYTDSLVYGDDWLETFPACAPNGTDLYFCRAKGYRKGMALDSIRYDLCRIRFDAQTQRFSDLQCVVPASKQQKSVSFPRVSPDGRYVLYVLSDYGNFSIWHPESDLYLLDTTTGQSRCLTEVNSNDVDSYPTWSSSGRWIVFSSKRMDGLWARPYIASFDPETGKAGHPFVLPQKEPDFYDQCTYTFNRPELILSTVTTGKTLEQAVARPAIPSTRPERTLQDEQ